MRPEAMDAIRGADDVFVSAASAWEVAIKTATGKIRIGAPFGEGVAQSGFVYGTMSCLKYHQKWPPTKRGAVTFIR